jgi:hypothetical protein
MRTRFDSHPNPSLGLPLNLYAVFKVCLIEFSAQAQSHAYGACPPEASGTRRTQSHV